MREYSAAVRVVDGDDASRAPQPHGAVLDAVPPSPFASRPIKNSTVNPVARAFEMAHSGAFRTRGEIAKAMAAEGFTIAECDQLSGPSLSRQLTEICRAKFRIAGDTA